MSSFKVGEIGIICNLIMYAEWNGREVTVTASLEKRLVISEPSRVVCTCECYGIDAPWLPATKTGTPWYILSANLRKRYLPPDWEKLATPVDQPIEEDVTA